MKDAIDNPDHAAQPADTALFTVTIEPFGWRFASDGSLSLLEAARVAGIILPSSCRNGTCRTCLCRVSSGRVDYRIEWPGVSADEKKEGWILPCVATASSALGIVAPGASRA